MTTNFGRDVSCTTSLRTGRYVTGQRLLAEALFRRLTTPRGKLRGGDAEQNYGLDVPGKIGQATTPSTRAALEDQIKSECEKDERVLRATASITEIKAPNGGVTYLVDIEAESALGPFVFQISVNDVTPEFLGFREDA